MHGLSGNAYPLGFAQIETVALVVNPLAGSGMAHRAAQHAVEAFVERDVDVVTLQGSSPDDARHMMSEVIADDRFDALVVVGGDGLVNLALQEQAGSGMPLGLIPSGTGNDHAREYSIPRHDARAAARVIADGFWTHTDLARITDAEGKQMWFGTIMCSGFDSLVTDRANTMSWPHGKNRYHLALAREFVNFKALPFRITLDDDVVLDDEITLAAFGNTRSYGGGMLICPAANHCDGVMDITVVGKASRLRAGRALSSVFSGKHVEYDEVTTHRAKKAHVEYVGNGEDLSVYADGEYMAKLPVTVEIVPGAGKFLVPRP
ncbi:diacylglycerol kinase [Corynebacterium sp. H113]|uniref:diacylglycerol kinase n=1 Tax=Corynebacterium sp. H113 TaxID=3133419 RepID=UPI0040402D22